MRDDETAKLSMRRLFVVLQLAISVPLCMGVVECAVHFNLI